MSNVCFLLLVRIGVFLIYLLHLEKIHGWCSETQESRDI